MSQVIPNSEAVADLLAMIFGEDIDVSEASAGDISDHHIATFLNPEDQLVAISACDIDFVAYSGAALSMIPKGVASDMIKEGQVNDMVKANFYEVMNICSKLMLSDNSPHLRLVDVLEPGDPSKAAIGALEGASARVFFDVDVPRYGKGRLSFSIQ